MQPWSITYPVNHISLKDPLDILLVVTLQLPTTDIVDGTYPNNQEIILNL